ncbi:MAG: hypothetical protein AVDCRST_MAG32-2764, partial [uncultured Nocardioides sp.]
DPRPPPRRPPVAPRRPDGGRVTAGGPPTPRADGAARRDRDTEAGCGPPGVPRSLDPHARGDPLPLAPRRRAHPGRQGAALPPDRPRRRDPRERPGAGPGPRARVDGGRVAADPPRGPRRPGPPTGDLLRGDPRADHHQRPGVPPTGPGDLRRRPRVAGRRHAVPSRGPRRPLHPRAVRGAVPAVVLPRLLRDVVLPGRPLRDHQPGALEARVPRVEPRRAQPPRLPPPGRQPRDRPLARSRPRRLLLRAGTRAGDDAAVQGHRRVLLQPLAAALGAV